MGIKEPAIPNDRAGRGAGVVEGMRVTTPLTIHAVVATQRERMAYSSSLG
jgi:hypothetical protein